MAVRLLAIIMTAVVLLGVVDVGSTLHQRAMSPPRYVLTMSDILATFGAFLALLIAMEIFVSIILYQREDVIQVKIVITALMAIARKVIILDLKELTPHYIWATGAVVSSVPACGPNE